jgi:putative membrane protein
VEAGGKPPLLRLHRVALAIFAIWFAVGLGLILLRVELPASWRWAEGLFHVLAALTTCVALARELPGQNVVAATAVILLASGVIESLGVLTGVPFGDYRYTDQLGARLFGILPWPIPLAWGVVLLSSRGVARLILWRWREVAGHGWRVLALAALLATALDVGLEPFAARVKGYWVWDTPPGAWAWHTAPAQNFLGWFASAFLILLLATPWLISKHPQTPRPFWHPLGVWLALNLFFAAGCAVRGLWSAMVLTVLVSLAVGAAAVTGTPPARPPAGAAQGLAGKSRR